MLKVPYLNYLNLKQINKLNYNNNKKNIILYSNIIKPFTKTKTLYNNSNHYMNKKIIIDNKNNFEKANEDSKKDNLFNGKKIISDLPEPKKNKNLTINKSCIFENFLKLGNINFFPRSKSVYVGSCFACDLGFSISRSGYSPMTFSPYNGKRREDCAKISTYLI